MAWAGQIGGMFFSAVCAEVDKEVLLSSDNFVDLVDGPLGFELHYRCHCGNPGVLYPGVAGRCRATAGV